MKRTLLPRFLLAASVLSVTGLTMFGQEVARPLLPEERRLQEGRLQEQRLDEGRLQEQRLREERLDEQRLQEERLRARRLRSAHARRKVLYVTPAMKKGRPQDIAQVRIQAAGGATIPLFNFSVVGYDAKTYTGEMVGRSPFFHGKRATTIPTVIIPIKLTFADSGKSFDPTAANACNPGSASVESLVMKSPIFQNATFTMNGANVGFTQYLDAFQRASFWSLVSGTPYHTVFSTSPTVLPAQPVAVPIGMGVTQTSGLCLSNPDWGTVDITWFDGQVQALITSLAGQGVTPAVFPQIILDSVAETIPGCCATGYHNSFLNNGVFQTYSVNEWDSATVFVGGTTDTMSHEVAEWMDDPNTSNPVPAWGAEGQVPFPNCQNNLEVGDPLTGTAFPQVLLSGETYDLQELAFFSWFYGGTSLGSGGLYSNNGSFTGFAKACPPGGTN